MSEAEKVQVEKMLRVLKLCKLPVNISTVVASMEEYFRKNGELTQKQLDYLMDIYCKY